MIEGCYGPKPAELKQLRRIQARWACKNTADVVQYAIEFSAMAKKKTVPEKAVEVDQEHGQEDDSRADRNLHELNPRLEMLGSGEGEVQAIWPVHVAKAVPEEAMEVGQENGQEDEARARPATDIAAKESSSIGGEGEDICVRRGMQTPRVSDRIIEGEKSDSVPRGRREVREGRARTKSRGSPIITRERQRRGATEEGVGMQSKKGGGAIRSTEMRQTARSEDRVVTRKTAALQGNARECDRRTTRSSARKNDGDGAVT